ncbi:MAG: AAA family ATPase [Candidatus Tectomicrobia bacterium]|uniref:AAA family ATPase n=1 Tax=Tectimicrobiota bacterium TaxID=2528274 RepID=A0A933GKH5_UNCTE|nr:AAA family ATPase [Candidatus Tectomicrobia bacterium]
MQKVREGFRSIRDLLDRYIVGHDDMKEALLLGVISREHIYLEGPPGTAKTMLAELASSSANLNFYFYQLHRDTRLAELVGDIVIAREKGPEGELIRQSIRRGGILTAEICILDDISRAPGEALNVLLRILNERKFGNEKIPLLTAIATSNPIKDDYYNEPLDPANLDRFTIQVKSQGLIQKNKWQEAMKVIDLYAKASVYDEAIPGVNRSFFDYTYEFLSKVELPGRVKKALIEFLSVLINKYKLDETNSLLTDRTFLVKAIKVLRAKALIEGRFRVELKDLYTLRYLTTFRVPPDIHERLDEILEELLNKIEQEPEEQPPQDGEPQEEQGSEEKEAKASAEEKEKEEKKITLTMDQNVTNKRMDLNGEEPGEEDQFLNPETVDNIEILLKTLKGRLEKNLAESFPHPGGQPRRWKRMNSFDDVLDSDLVESTIWSENLHPQLPRVLHRERNIRGGELAILRDVSSSMMGRYSKWASAVVAGLMELARKQRMRVGYIEFNHMSMKYLDTGKFFTRDYDKIFQRACNIKCFGYTNYQRSLSDALVEFSNRRMHNKHIVFLTDGVPTQGDWEVKKERELAQKFGVSIHSIFIGTSECPKILEIISDETGGSQFQAATDRRGVIRILERDLDHKIYNRRANN